MVTVGSCGSRKQSLQCQASACGGGAGLDGASPRGAAPSSFGAGEPAGRGVRTLPCTLLLLQLFIVLLLLPLLVLPLCSEASASG